MNYQKIYNKAIRFIEHWEKELERYNLETLLKKPAPESWSLGQVYNHLIQSALDFHLRQIEICAATDENRSKRKNSRGIVVFHILHDVPPIKIHVPPSETYTPKQPSSIQELADGLQQVRAEMKKSLALLESNPKKGKTAHPGFGFLNAGEWFMLAELHFKHHLRQKERIDNFLKGADDAN